MSIGTIPPIKHKTYLKCKLLKKLRKHITLLRNNYSSDLHYEVKGSFIEDSLYYDAFLDALCRYHIEMKYIISKLYPKLYVELKNRERKKCYTQILP